MNADQILRELCSTPTAPFAEQHVIRFVEAFVAARKRLKLSRDEYGNLLIELRQPPRGARHPRWVFTAHMDHPGFVASKMLDATTLAADFRGWVAIEYVRGTKVRFFETDGREIPGVVIEATTNDYDRLAVPQRVKVRVKRTVSTGSPGMFDQGPGRTKGGRFFSRVCDDLAGAAAALALMDELSRKPPKTPVAVLLTRAEEEGFIGAIAASLKPRLIKKSDRLIAIECSAMQPYVPQGDGVIIRIGDKTSVFNSDLSYFITHQAGELAKKDKRFKFQRALMPGGTCEATVYDIYGFTAASICVALGNYHNMDRGRKTIGPEYIDLNDWRSMVKLFVHLARSGHTYEPGHRLLKRRIEKRFKKLKHLLR
ncbi:MAG: M20/M25/M40 family metallo-hydrolase [Tepidisphaeraceae bacterium]